MFKTRLLTTLVILPAFIAAMIFLPPLYWHLLMYFAVMFAVWEWADMAYFNKAQALIYLMLFSAIILPIAMFSPGWGYRQPNCYREFGCFLGYFCANLVEISIHYTA